jgi:L-ascorbate metabolism protein UlaG (beta-lactamase superfamily)
MADYAAELASAPGGTAITARTGTTSADTVPAGAVVLWRNTGAGVHVVTLTTNNTTGGLAVADQTISVTNATQKSSRILPEWGDANGRVAVGIDGTAAEITYYVLGGV